MVVVVEVVVVVVDVVVVYVVVVIVVVFVGFAPKLTKDSGLLFAAKAEEELPHL